MKTPTMKDNILDLVFSNDKLILTIETKKTNIVSNHNIINAETNIPVKCIKNHLHNEPASLFESIDFNISDWKKIKFTEVYFNTWVSELDPLNVEQCLQKISDILYEICTKHRGGKRVSKYFKILMRKHCRLCKKLDSSNCDDQKCGYEQKIRDIEKSTREIHRDEQNPVLT